MTNQVVCIHGMWTTPTVWDVFKETLEAKGYEVHTPALPYHNSIAEQQCIDLGRVSLSEYSASMIKFVNSFSEPPILIGHSMGGLIAQIVAANVPVAQLVLLNPSASAEISAIRLSVVRLFRRVLMTWGFWRKPVRLNWKEVQWGIFNGHSLEVAARRYEEQIFESGRSGAEIAFPFFDPHKVASVDASKITCPVLVLGCEDDRIVPASVCKATAARYPQAEYKELKNMGHWIFDGWPLESALAMTLGALESHRAKRRTQTGEPAALQSG